MDRSRRAIVALLLLLLAGLTAPGSAGAQAKRCFAENGQCVEGRFLEYWNQNGGLAVFGLPLGPARQEQNHDTGKAYLTQWFERARFELHPENKAPYDVLLGRLGADQLRQGNTVPVAIHPEHGQPPASRQPQDGCRWFPETRFNVCDEVGLDGPARFIGFRSYWERHGLNDPKLDASGRSLALLGLPISGMFYAYNTSGDFVLMQYFERARLELHPQPAGQALVLQGRLGAEVSAPMTIWQIVRSRIPADMPVYQPGGLPDGYAANLVFFDVEKTQGCTRVCYTLAYQGRAPEEQIAFILNQGYQGWGAEPALPDTPGEPIIVNGVSGVLKTGSRVSGQTPVTIYVASWVESGQIYRVVAESATLTRADILAILAGLTQVK